MKEKWCNIYLKYKEGILYLFFGGATTLVNFIIFTAIIQIFKVNLGVANLLAFIGSVIFAFITNEKYVFEKKEKDTRISAYLKKGIKFFISRIATFLIETVLLYVVVAIGIQVMISKVIVAIITIILNYVLSKVWIFSN